MHGQGSYSSRLDQNQAPLQPPYQQHVPGLFPPRAPFQSSVLPQSSVNQVPAAFSHGGHSAPVGPPPMVRHGPPLQAPAHPLSSTIPPSQSFVNPLQRPLIPGSMPMPSAHLSIQQNSHHSPHAGNPVMHRSLAPLGGPRWPDLSRNLPPPRLPPPPPIQEQTTCRPSVSSQAMLPGTVQGVLHSVPGSSGSLVHANPVPYETRFPSNASSVPSSSPSFLPRPSRPSVHLPSSSMLHTTSNLQQQCELEDGTRKSVLESGSTMNGSGAQDIPAEPPRPTEETFIQKIEILCQFIAKNGPGFEDMARKREASNPEFRFLFGGDPGSEAAIAHDYFQWLKKKLCSTGRLPEGENHSPSRHSEVCPPRQPERLTLASTSDARADSDMEMEDDITQFNDDGATSKSVQDLSCGTGFVQVKMDSEGQPYVVPDTVDDAAPENVLSEKVPCPGGATISDQGKGSLILSQQNHHIPESKLDEVHLDYDFPGSAKLSPGGIVEKSTALKEDAFISSSVCEHANFGTSSAKDVESPFRLPPQDYPSDASLENNDMASHPGKHIEMVRQSVVEDPINASENIKVDIIPDIPSKVEKAAMQLFEAARTDRASLDSLQLRNGHKETHATSSVLELINEDGDESHDQGLVQAVPYAEPLDPTEYNNHSPKTLNGSEDHNFKSAPIAVKVDEFGRLIREGVSDSDSDDSYHAREHNKRGRIRGRGQSPESRSRKHSTELKRREKRSLSRSWSPRGRRSRSRSPRRRRSRSRSPRKRRSRSRSPGRRRSRSPLRRAGQFRGDSMRKDRGRKPECFDFLRGRCYRGASCRYLHHDPEQDGSRHKRREPRNTEMPSGPGNSKAIEETYDKSLESSKRADDDVKTQRLQPCPTTRGGGFGSLGVQKVEEVNYFDNVETDEQGAAVQSQENTVQDEAKKLYPGIPYTTTFKQEEDIQGTLSVDFHCQPMSNADAVTTHGKTLDIDISMKSSQEALQVNLDSVVSANPLSYPICGASGLEESSDKTFTSSLVTPIVGTNAWNFPKDQKVGSGASFLSQPAPHGGIPSTMLSNTQPHLSSAPPSFAPNVLPAPDVSGGTAAHGGGGSATHVGYTQYQQSRVPLNTNFDPQAFLKPYPSLMCSEDQRPGTLPAGIPNGEQFGGPSLTREALSFNNMNPYPTGNAPPAELSRTSQVHSYLSLQQREDTGGLDVPRKMTMPVYPQDLQHMNHTSFQPDNGSSRVPSHYNPYASNFEQPYMSRFSGDMIPQDYSSQYNTPQGVQGGGSAQINSSMKSAAGIQQTLAQSRGDQYDPLFDSVEPSSNSIKKLDHSQRQGSIGDSDAMFSRSGSNKPLDEEENNKKKEIEALILSTSMDGDGFGDTAYAEAGDVENASTSNAFDETDDMVGEFEIDQVKSPGDSKKHKEPRSSKLFKVALANFVKEVLKPSWREGNMSKEAFKTIVKKTVDKVTGAMKSHHIPKSQSKINHYIDSSQRKLTKLVMGYVDKYVKV